jgi:hypothetical protein
MKSSVLLDKVLTETAEDGVSNTQKHPLNRSQFDCGIAQDKRKLKPVDKD